MYRTDFWTLWEKARVGCFKRTALKHVYYQGWNRSPAQVGCIRQVLGPGTLGRPRGIGWRGRWERGSGWGIHVNPWLIHFNVWQNPLQYCKVIRLQLIKNKIKFKKRCRKIKLTWNSTLRYPSMTHQWSHKYISFMRSYHTCYFYCYLFKERRFSSFSNSVHCYPVFCPGHPC